MWNVCGGVFFFLQIQSFAGRLARARELKTSSLPSWWKSDVHDAHLLIASCIYGVMTLKWYCVVGRLRSLRVVLLVPNWSLRVRVPYIFFRVQGRMRFGSSPCTTALKKPGVDYVLTPRPIIDSRFMIWVFQGRYIPGLYGTAHDAGWEKYNLHDLTVI